MTSLAIICSRFGRFAVLACGLAFLSCGELRAQPAQAAAGPFAELPGQWNGTGKIQFEGQTSERIRCSSTNRARGGSQIDLQLKCDSDTYKFDFVGDVEAGADNAITGRWTERTRNVGGSVIGSARGERIQIHIESSAFAADLVIIARNRRMSVSIDSAGGGVKAKTAIAMSRR